jgi:N-acetylglucosaminyldiphosphoundecaprenol N-acetyl-beta-D-mannosaminyltransferase
MIMLAQRDVEYMRILQNAELVSPDGIGIILASWIGRRPIKQRVTGIDLMTSLLEKLARTEYTVYLLGAAPGVAEAAKQNLEKKFPGLKIIGVHDGYFDAEEDRIICENLRMSRPDLLMLGISMGKAEKWAETHRDLPVRVIACIGGALDVLGGKVKRAPIVFRKLGLEWLYRLLKQPGRARRMLQLPIFAVVVFREYIVRGRRM